jgi:hypothetical protein
MQVSSSQWSVVSNQFSSYPTLSIPCHAERERAQRVKNLHETEQI